jgi:hypothetical protein
MPQPPTTARYCAFLCVLTVALTACTGLPSQPNGAATLQRTPARVAGSQSTLLYTGGGHFIQVFTYPGGVLETTVRVTAAVSAMCSDSAGDVFVTTSSVTKGVETGAILEYSHGGTSPIATLDLPTHEIPANCSSDPTTGDLAVTSYDAHTFAPQIQVYAHASGSPKTYVSKTLGANPQPAYDGSGNLFVTSGGNVGTELPEGKQSLQKITLSETLGGVDHLQWDGKHFALQSFQNSQNGKERLLVHVYRVQISGTTGTVVGYSHFVNWLERDAGQSWIQDDTIVATPGSQIVFWNYPAGGKSVKTIHPAHPAKAVTVSTAG